MDADFTLISRYQVGRNVQLPGCRGSTLEIIGQHSAEFGYRSRLEVLDKPSIRSITYDNTSGPIAVFAGGSGW